MSLILVFIAVEMMATPGFTLEKEKRRMKRPDEDGLTFSFFPLFPSLQLTEAVLDAEIDRAEKDHFLGHFLSLFHYHFRVVISSFISVTPSKEFKRPFFLLTRPFRRSAGERERATRIKILKQKLICIRRPLTTASFLKNPRHPFSSKFS